MTRTLASVLQPALVAGLLLGALPPVFAAERTQPTLAPIPLTLAEVLEQIDRTHPLLQGSGTEKVIAKGKLLKALGQFEPQAVIDNELERFIPSGQTQTKTAGFSDYFLDMRDPSGVKGIAGYRQAVGANAKIPDLKIGENGQLLLGASVPLLRGLLTNPESAELQRSGLADPKADVQIAQTRQDLFLAGASQYWDWVAAIKLMDVQRRALKVAEDRLKQIEGRAKAGAVPPLDVVEANQEVQRRKELLIAATRQVEQEQYKLSMFLWSGQEPVRPKTERAPEFPKESAPPPPETVEADKVTAKTVRPEIKEVEIEAQLNNIDLELAKNNLLPSLDADAAPARNPEKFVLGLGYRFGLELRVPIFQRRSRGEVLEAQGKADKLVLLQLYRQQQAVVDVDNALSAIERAQQRITAAADALRMAKTLEEGERFRFNLGATSVLFVNLRERNAVDSENQLIRARADYQKALALYQWATGAWAQPPATVIPVTYKQRP